MLEDQREIFKQESAARKRAAERNRQKLKVIRYTVEHKLGDRRTINMLCRDENNVIQSWKVAAFLQLGDKMKSWQAAGEEEILCLIDFIPPEDRIFLVKAWFNELSQEEKRELLKEM